MGCTFFHGPCFGSSCHFMRDGAIHFCKTMNNLLQLIMHFFRKPFFHYLSAKSIDSENFHHAGVGSGINLTRLTPCNFLNCFHSARIPRQALCRHPFSSPLPPMAEKSFV